MLRSASCVSRSDSSQPVIFIAKIARATSEPLFWRRSELRPPKFERVSAGVHGRRVGQDRERLSGAVHDEDCDPLVDREAHRLDGHVRAGRREHDRTDAMSPPREGPLNAVAVSNAKRALADLQRRVRFRDKEQTSLQRRAARDYAPYRLPPSGAAFAGETRISKKKKLSGDFAVRAHTAAPADLVAVARRKVREARRAPIASWKNRRRAKKTPPGTPLIAPEIKLHAAPEVGVRLGVQPILKPAPEVRV